MSSFQEWLGAIFTNWQSWASGGGIGGAVVLLIQIAEWMDWFKVRPRTKAFFFVWPFLLGASYVAWKDQHDKLVSAQAQIQTLNETQNPKLVGTLLEAAFFRADNGMYEVMMQVMIINRGADSIVQDFRVEAKEHGRSLPTKVIFIPDGFNLRMNVAPGNLSLSTVDSLSENRDAYSARIAENRIFNGGS